MNEESAFKVMKLDQGGPVTIDDKITLRAEKTAQGGRLSLNLTEDHWKLLTPRKKGGEPVINGYWKPDRAGKQFISTAEYYGLAEKNQGAYRPFYEKYLEVDTDTLLIFRGNTVDLYMLNLCGNFQSRYLQALSKIIDLCDKGVIAYKPRGEETAKHKREAMRQVLKRCFIVAEYEWCVCFPERTGRAINRALRSGKAQGLDKYDKVVLQDNTIYLKGYEAKKKRQMKLKFYDTGVRDGEQSGKLKLEVTLYNHAFKNLDIQVKDMGTQPDIQKLLSPKLARGIRGMLKMIPKVERREILQMIQDDIGKEFKGKEAEKIKQIADELVKPERTIEQRVKALEESQEQLEKQNKEILKRLEKVEKSQIIKRVK